MERDDRRPRAAQEAGPAARVAFLSRPESYPGAVTRVEVRETHMSWVFLTAEHAYKLRKPVRYAFLDFATVEARRRDCEAELRLNRRLAPAVYLAVVPLLRLPGGGLRLGGGETPRPAVEDWLVQMRRLPARHMLDQRLRAGAAVGAAELRRVAALLAAFYRRARPAERSAERYRRRLLRYVAENRAALLRPGLGLPVARVRAACAWQREVLMREPALFDARVRAGRVIEAHGDLRPEHVCLAPEPAIIDCLEFRREFRVLDSADELAFLMLECERLGAPQAGRSLARAVWRRTGDRPPAALLAFHAAFRATLRARLAAWHSHEPGAAGAAAWRRRARAYLELAAAHGGSLPAVRLRGARGRG